MIQGGRQGQHEISLFNLLIVHQKKKKIFRLNNKHDDFTFFKFYLFIDLIYELYIFNS